MFSGLPDPNPLVRYMDPGPSIIKQKSKKNLHSHCFVTTFDFLSFKFLSLKNDVNVPSRSNKQKIVFTSFLMAS